MTSLRLISFDTCPYVERSRIVLHEKGQDFEQDFVDLSDKPDWFLQLSPRGKVPVLVVDEVPIFESSVINELLDELIPEPPMFPDDPIRRALGRSWIEYCNAVVMPSLAKYWFAGDDTERRQRARKEIRKAFERVNAQLAEDGSGPYFLGTHFGLVDASYAPIFTRWETMKELGESALIKGLDNLTDYGHALLDRPSVQQAKAKHLTQ